jgi:hypothetical protein
MPFKKGEGGRKPGTKNKVTQEIRLFCRELLETQEYRDYFKHRLLVGQLPPALESMVWHYAYDKPIERQEHSGPEGGDLVIRWGASE